MGLWSREYVASSLHTIRHGIGGGGQGEGGSGEVFIWDVQSGEHLQAWSEPTAIVCSLAWSPTGAVLLSGGSDGSMRWWDTRNGEGLRVQKGHQGAVQSLRVSPDGKTLASCGDDNAIQLWDLQSGVTGPTSDSISAG